MIRQAAILAGAAILVGLLANALHPHGVKILRALPARANDDPNYITLDAARERLADGRALFLDVRSPAEFERGHIEGAWNVPANDFDREYPKVARFVAVAPEVVLYCESRRCTLAADVARRLQGLGVSRVRIFEGGWDAWSKP
jgi:rhodanese-related sulfurtransferase